MPCERVVLPGGEVAFVRYAKKRKPKCAFCDATSTRLCDGEIGKTLGGDKISCDKPICPQHTKAVGENTDYCPRHW